METACGPVAMNRLAIPIVAVALLTAACGAAATVSSSGKRAGDGRRDGAGERRGERRLPFSDITNRPNPPIDKARDGQPMPPATTGSVVPAAGKPAFGTALYRCSGGIGTDVEGSQSGRPKPLHARFWPGRLVESTFLKAGDGS